jgi:hypothetical protein
MTSMLERPGTEAPPTSTRQRPSRADLAATIPVAGVTAALWAAAVGMAIVGALVIVAWAASSRGGDSLSSPISASGVLWLVAHHAGVAAPEATITLLPLALLAVPLVLLVRAGRWAARITSVRTTSDAVLLVGAGSAGYAGVAVGVASLAALGDAHVSELSALLWAGGLAVVGLTVGVLQESALGPAWAVRFPRVFRDAAPALLASGAVVVVAAGAVTIAAIATRWATVTGLAASASHSAWDSAGLFLVSLAYLPNLLVWAIAYIAGPGFSVGGGAVVDPFSMSGALLPGVPILGAIPQDAPAAAPLLLFLPVLAGMVGALVLRRRRRLHVLDEVVTLVLAAAILGVVVGLLCALSGGALGWGRLAFLGPSGLVVGPALAALVAAGALLWSLVARVMPTVWVRESDLTVEP